MCFLILPCILNGQPRTIEEALAGADRSNFLSVQNALNNYYELNPEAAGYKQWKRREWFLEPRLYPSGKYRNITRSNHLGFREVEREINTGSRSTHGNWFFMGPSAYVPGAGGDAGLGRVNSVKIHPADEDIIYIGASNGGIWKTTDGGGSWQNISPYIPLLSIADIGLDPEDPDIVYALTGDGDPSPPESGAHGQTEISSIGIIRSTNGGASWHPTGFSFSHPSAVVPVKLLMNPASADTQFVVGNNGIYKTVDAWQSYYSVYSLNTVYDIEYHPTNTMIMYASGSNWIRRSIDGGESFAVVQDDNFAGVLTAATRVELAVGPALAAGIYAMAADWDSLRGFYWSLSAGLSNTWSLRDSTTNSHGKFATYCIALEINPSVFTDVYGGMQWMNRSQSGGLVGTWNSIVSSPLHADVHDIVMTSNALYVGCDGGLYKSTDNGNSWTDLSEGLAITEIYRIGGTPESTNRFYTGTQDNGTFRRIGSNTFTSADGGDGMTCRINYSNWDTVFVSRQRGVFRRSIDGGNTFATMSVPGDESAWISPMIMDPVDPDVLFFGKDSLYRTDSGGFPYVYLGEPTGNDLNCLAQGTSNRNRLYCSSSSNIVRTDNALTNAGPPSYTNIGAGLPNQFITDIAVDPANSLRVFVTLSGYADSTKVFMSPNGGVDWDNISGNLPNVPANCIEYIPTNPNIDAMYIGTDIGVFYRDDNIGDWIYFSNSLPAVNVSDLYAHPDNGLITAGTYGRGLWQSSMYSDCVENLLHADQGEPLGGVRFLSASNTITSTAEFRADLGTETYYSAGQKVLLTPGFRVRARAIFEAKIGDCPGITGLPLQSPQVPSGMWVPGVDTAELYD